MVRDDISDYDDINEDQQLINWKLRAIPVSLQ